MSPEINAGRLLRRLKELRSIGASSNGGVTRLAYSDEDVSARRLVGTWMEEAGMTVELDAATNLIGRKKGQRWPGALAMGSHLDTVVEGGYLDGAYGVVAAIEVVSALAEGPTLLGHDLVVIVFSNEEGSRGSPAMVGSQVIAGTFDEELLRKTDDEGVTLHDRLVAAGGRPDALSSSAWSNLSVESFVELHIEQGPILETSKKNIGVVDGITGRRVVDVTVIGVAGHAGTVPMEARRDALCAAARIVLEVEELARSGFVRVATTGALICTPSVRNVIPSQVQLGIEFRDESKDTLNQAIEKLSDFCASAAAQTATEIRIHCGTNVAPVTMTPWASAAIEDAAKELGANYLHISSGAGHDAQSMAAIAPVGMIFIPSMQGSSHTHSENSSDQDLVMGAEVLLHTLIIADGTSNSTSSEGVK